MKSAKSSARVKSLNVDFLLAYDRAVTPSSV